MGVLTGTITETGATDDVELGIGYNVSLRDFGTATINLERSFDSGASWGVIETFTENTEVAGTSHESALYRFNTTAFSSGPITFRLAG
jgi:hypothetical protein